jgi:hypothetical protein
MASTLPALRGGSPSGADPEVWFPIRTVMGTSLDASLQNNRIKMKAVATPITGKMENGLIAFVTVLGHFVNMPLHQPFN